MLLKTGSVHYMLSIYIAKVNPDRNWKANVHIIISNYKLYLYSKILHSSKNKHDFNFKKYTIRFLIMHKVIIIIIIIIINQGTNARRCPMPFSLFDAIFVSPKQRGTKCTKY